MVLRQRFYELIEAAREGSEPSTPSADAAALEESLLTLDSEELVEFVLAFDDELIRLNHWSVWGAGYIAEGGLSDDGFHYFRGWLIGKGMRAVDAVLQDPDALADFLDDGDHENEDLEYAGVGLLQDRGLADPREADGRVHADAQPAGEPFDEDTVEDAYPRTAAAAD